MVEAGAAVGCDLGVVPLAEAVPVCGWIGEGFCAAVEEDELDADEVWAARVESLCAACEDDGLDCDEVEACCAVFPCDCEAVPLDDEAGAGCDCEAVPPDVEFCVVEDDELAAAELL